MQHLSCQKMHFRVAISCTCFRSARRTSRVRPTSTAWRTSPAAGRVPGSSRSDAQHQPNYPKSSLSLRGLLCVTSGLSMEFSDSLPPVSMVNLPKSECSIDILEVVHINSRYCKLSIALNKCVPEFGPVMRGAEQ